MTALEMHGIVCVPLLTVADYLDRYFPSTPRPSYCPSPMTLHQLVTGYHGFPYSERRCFEGDVNRVKTDLLRFYRPILSRFHSMD